jgi:DNA-binding GntR family transcriptional regulator
MPTSPPTLVLLSLREQVYEHLKSRMQAGSLVPGVFLDLGSIAAEMGISRTPLRDALLQLETEGFVEILPRRGVRVAELTLERIRDIYELLGALESAALRSVGERMDGERIARMAELNRSMRADLEAGRFERFYARNLEFHDCWLELSPNAELVRSVRILKQRLYDFPSKPELLCEWELASTEEHRRVVELLEAGELGAAADFVRDVHWSYDVQETYVRRYYFDEGTGEPAE